MTTTLVDTETTNDARKATKRTVLMCRPDYLHRELPHQPVDAPGRPDRAPSVAVDQWKVLYQTYLDLGFDVKLIDPIEGLPDMVYAANGGFVLDNIAYGASFTYPQRQPEGPAYMNWFRDNGYDVHEPENINEGEGDILLVGDVILAGTGFRTDTGEPPGDRARLRPRGHHAGAGEPELLPPRHRHRGARPGGRQRAREHRLPAVRVQRARASPCCASATPTRSSSAKRMPRCSASTRTPTATTS